MYSTEHKKVSVGFCWHCSDKTVFN